MLEPWDFSGGCGKRKAGLSSEWLGACASVSPHWHWGGSAVFLGVTEPLPCWDGGGGRQKQLANCLSLTALAGGKQKKSLSFPKRLWRAKVTH